MTHDEVVATASRGPLPLALPRELWATLSPAQQAVYRRAESLLDAFSTSRELGLSELFERGPRAEVLRALEVLGSMALVRIQATDAGASSLSLFVEPGQLEGGVATTGAGGYRRHQVEFERGEANALLIGTGRDLIRLSFAAPASVRGRPHGPGFQLEAELGAPAVLMQLSFTAERVEAENLAREAQLAEQQGRRGHALRLWSRLRDELPFDAALVERADAQRSRLVQEGMALVQEIKLEFERARFFRLVDIFRQCEISARACADTYSGTEVESAALELLGQVKAELDLLEAGLDEFEVLRLIAILEALEARQMPQLAARVRAVLRDTYGVDDPGAFKAALEASTEPPQ